MSEGTGQCRWIHNPLTHYREDNACGFARWIETLFCKTILLGKPRRETETDRECEGQLPIRIRLTFHARFRCFSPPPTNSPILSPPLLHSLLSPSFPHLHKRFYIRNIINKYQTRLISTRFVRIFPRYLQLIGSKVSFRREKKNRWISFRVEPLDTFESRLLDSTGDVTSQSGMYPGVCVRVPRHGSRKFIPAGYIEAAVKQSLGPLVGARRGTPETRGFQLGSPCSSRSFFFFVVLAVVVVVVGGGEFGSANRGHQLFTSYTRCASALRRASADLPGAIDTDVINAIRRCWSG